MLKAPYVHRVPLGTQLMDLNRVAYHPGQDRGGDIRLMSVIIIVMASLVYSVSRGFNVQLILTSISLLLSYSLSLHHLLLLSSQCVSVQAVRTHACLSNELVRTCVCRWLAGGCSYRKYSHSVAPSCKMELARFSSLLKIQDGAKCGNNYL